VRLLGVYSYLFLDSVRYVDLSNQVKP